MDSDPLISDELPTQPLRRFSKGKTMQERGAGPEGLLPPPPEPALDETTPVEVTRSDTHPALLAVPAPAAPATAPVPCPRCGERLVNPDGLKFCSACGYCGSIEQGLGSLKPGQSRLGVTEALHTVSGMPNWVWVTAGGMFAVALCSAGVGQLLPEHSYPRAVWGTAQLGVGLLLAFVMQLWLLMELAPYDHQLGHLDLLPSPRLWLLALRCMPETCWPVWLAVWGLTASACAAVFIGGLTYWFHPGSASAAFLHRL